MAKKEKEPHPAQIQPKPIADHVFRAMAGWVLAVCALLSALGFAAACGCVYGIFGIAAAGGVLLLAFAVGAAILLHAWRRACGRYFRPLSQAVDAVGALCASGDAPLDQLNRNMLETASLLEAAEGMRARRGACLQELDRVLTRLTSGDLTVRLQCGQMGQCPGVCGKLDEVSQRLRGSIGGVRSALDQVVGQFDTLEQEAAALSQDGQRQKQAQEGVRQSVERLEGRLQRRAVDARELNTLAELLCRRIEAYDKCLADLAHAMERVIECSGESHKIIRSMEDAAFQGSVLARTAYVEAARAGVDGKGFAVIASELRIQAARSAQSAQDAAALLDEMDRTVKEGAAAAAAAVQDFQDMRDGGETLRRRSASASGEGRQGEAAEEAVRCLGQLDEAVEGMLAQSGRSAETGRQLRRRVEKLREVLHAFRLN